LIRGVPIGGGIPPAPLDKGGADRRGDPPLIRGVPIGGGIPPAPLDKGGV